MEGATEGWTVTPPAHRFDLAIEEDLIEEVVRLHGYHRLPAIPQRVISTLTRVTETRVSTDRARQTLIDRGYQEIISYSFTDAEEQRQLLGTATELELSNPISRELSVMRRSLWPGLLQAVSANQKRQQNPLAPVRNRCCLSHGGRYDDRGRGYWRRCVGYRASGTLGW